MDTIPDAAAFDENTHTTSRKSTRPPRMELITRGERRRRWTPEQKREIVAESYGPELTSTDVACKHGISSGQLYTWRHELLGLRAPVVSRAVPRFAEVALKASSPSVSPVRDATPRASRAGGRIEIVLPGNIIVRIDAEVDEAALGRVLDPLRRR
jgi:transposase